MARHNTFSNSSHAPDAGDCPGNTPRTIARKRKQPRVVVKIEPNLTDNSRLINRASLHLAELIAQQIARDVLRVQSTSSTPTSH